MELCGIPHRTVTPVSACVPSGIETRPGVCVFGRKGVVKIVVRVCSVRHICVCVSWRRSGLKTLKAPLGRVPVARATPRARLRSVRFIGSSIQRVLFGPARPGNALGDLGPVPNARIPQDPLNVPANSQTFWPCPNWQDGPLTGGLFMSLDFVFTSFFCCLFALRL